jgi:hypothetical protein
MSVCVAIVQGLITQVTDSSCDYVVLSKDEVTQLVEGQFDLSLLQFDQALYEMLLGQFLVTFIVGHALGRVIKYLGKK